MGDGYDCLVVPVHYRPNVITCEFACIGVILKCRETGYEAFRLADDDEKVIARIVAFFPERGREEVERAMAWARRDIAFAFAADRRKGGEEAFSNLIRPRENIVRYGNPQSVYACDPVQELDNQYVLQVRTRE